MWVMGQCHAISYNITMKSIMDIRKEYQQKKFLELSPLERIKRMHAVITEIIAIKAKAEGITEYEIYRRYLKNNPRHYQGISS